MSRHIYALVVDCDEASESVESVLTELASAIHQRDWPDVIEVHVHTDIPLELDERRQDRSLTQPVITLEAR